MIASELRFIRFLIAGSVSIPFNLAGRALFSTVVSFDASVVGAQLVGMSVAYLAMRVLVFGSSGRSPASEFTRFAMVNAFSLAQTWAVSVALLAVIPSAMASVACREFGAHVFGLGTTAVTSFLLHRSFSFGGARPVGRAAASAGSEAVMGFGEVDRVG